jgi:phosphatidylglycerol---prolipoprotein diacylglyceryl transferase
MYPTVSDLLKDLFGFSIPLPVQTFGFFMALSFVGAYYTTSAELVRKTSMGLLNPVQKMVTRNRQITPANYMANMLIYGLLGFKGLEILLDYNALVANPQAFILSSKGNFIGFLLGVAAGYYISYRDAQKVKGKTEEKVLVTVQPADLMWNITAIAGIAGIIGAKVFHNLEYIDDLIADPVDALLSFSGLTFYGGLIVATVAVLYYTSKHKIPTLHMIDAAAPGLMLAYGIGRIGCQLSGDGDWGIVNTSPKPGSLSFLPDWAWSFNYPHNVIDEGVLIPGCEGAHCYMLPQPVYPTPLYEVAMALFLFGVLWSIRKRITIPGVLFGVYLVVNGFERFFIEKIRVNSTYQLFGKHITQAEIISSLMIVTGIIGIIILVKRSKNEKEPARISP